MDIPLPEDPPETKGEEIEPVLENIPVPDETNRYSPSLPIEDDPLDMKVDKEDAEAAILTTVSEKPSSSGTTVLGKEAAKKRLLAFSLTKQSSNVVKKSKTNVLHEVAKMSKQKEAGDALTSQKKKKKGVIDKARDTISEIEELKRREIEVRESMQLLYPLWGTSDAKRTPVTSLINDEKSHDRGESVVEKLLMKRSKHERKAAERQEREEEKRRRRERREKKEKERERRMPKSWSEFKKEGFKIYHFRRVKFKMEKLTEAQKRKSSRSKDHHDLMEGSGTVGDGSSGRKMNLLETPMVLKSPFLVTGVNNETREFPSWTVRLTNTWPKIYYGSNPIADTTLLISRQQLIKSIPDDIYRIVKKFWNKTGTDRFAAEINEFPQNSRPWFPKDNFLEPDARNNLVHYSDDDEEDINNSYLDEEILSTENYVPSFEEEISRPKRDEFEDDLGDTETREEIEEERNDVDKYFEPEVQEEYPEEYEGDTDVSESGYKKDTPVRERDLDMGENGNLVSEYEQFMKTIEEAEELSLEDQNPKGKAIRKEETVRNSPSPVIHLEKEERKMEQVEDDWSRTTSMDRTSENSLTAEIKKKKSNSKVKLEVTDKEKKDKGKKRRTENDNKVKKKKIPVKSKKRRRSSSSSSSSSSTSSSTSSSSSSSSSSGSSSTSSSSSSTDSSSDSSSSSSESSSSSSSQKKRSKRRRRKLKKKALLKKKLLLKKKISRKKKKSMKSMEISDQTSKKSKRRKKVKLTSPELLSNNVQFDKCNDTDKKSEKMELVDDERMEEDSDDRFESRNDFSNKESKDEPFYPKVVYEESFCRSSRTSNRLDDDIDLDKSDKKSSWECDDMDESKASTEIVEPMFPQTRQPEEEEAVESKRHFNLDVLQGNLDLAINLPDEIPLTNENSNASSACFKETTDLKDESKETAIDMNTSLESEESSLKYLERYSPTAEDEEDNEELNEEMNDCTVGGGSEQASLGLNTASEEARMLDIPLPPPIEPPSGAPPTSFHNILHQSPPPEARPTEPRPSVGRSPMAKITFGKQITKLKPLNVFSTEDSDSENGPEKAALPHLSLDDRESTQDSNLMEALPQNNSQDKKYSEITDEEIKSTTIGKISLEVESNIPSPVVEAPQEAVVEAVNELTTSSPQAKKSRWDQEAIYINKEPPPEKVIANFNVSVSRDITSGNRNFTDINKITDDELCNFINKPRDLVKPEKEKKNRSRSPNNSERRKKRERSHSTEKDRVRRSRTERGLSPRDRRRSLRDRKRDGGRKRSRSRSRERRRRESRSPKFRNRSPDNKKGPSPAIPPKSLEETTCKPEKEEEASFSDQNQYVAEPPVGYESARPRDAITKNSKNSLNISPKKNDPYSDWESPERRFAPISNSVNRKESPFHSPRRKDSPIKRRSPELRWESPGRKYSPRRRDSPIRRRSPYSPRRKSPLRRRSPERKRTPPHRRRLSPSPNRRRHSPSPDRRRPSLSPGRRKHSPSLERRRRTPSLERRRPSISPKRKHSPSIERRRRTPTPERRRQSLSPGRRRFTPSPERRRQSVSPNRRRSPDRRRSSLSPERRRRSNSPGHRRPSPSSRFSRKTPPVDDWSWESSKEVRASEERRYEKGSDQKWNTFEQSHGQPRDDFQTSLADSTISDSELVKEPSSPKRLSLDERLQLELGGGTDGPCPPKVPPPVYQGYYAYPPPDQSIPPPFYPPQQFTVPPPNIYPSQADWNQNQLRAPPPAHPNQLVQVGNVLQVVPTESKEPAYPTHPPPKMVGAAVTTPPSARVVQVGNVLQVVPSQKPPPPAPPVLPPPAPVACYAASSPTAVPPPPPPAPAPAPLCRVALPFPPGSPNILLKLEEKEKRKRDKELRKQKKEQKAARRMLRKALLRKRLAQANEMENENNEIESNVEVAQNESNDNENSKSSVILPSPEKGILIAVPSAPILLPTPKEKRKSVSFADGVRPGEGTSPSGGEEHPMSPPPMPARKTVKKKKKRKVKVRIIRVEQNAKETEEEEDEDETPPPPPPGTPPPEAYLDLATAGNYIYPVVPSSQHQPQASYPDGQPPLPVALPTAPPAYAAPHQQPATR